MGGIYCIGGLDLCEVFIGGSLLVEIDGLMMIFWCVLVVGLFKMVMELMLGIDLVVFVVVFDRNKFKFGLVVWSWVLFKDEGIVFDV